MILPAVNGVISVMKAAAKYKVKRVIYTSSVAAIAHKDPADDDYVYDETSWT